MKPRHAVALALVGWYLMMPPPLYHHGGKETVAPLSEWKVIDKFASKGECEEARSKLIERMGTSIKSANCISSDDPRLHAESST
jgi:hypothetical protein